MARLFVCTAGTSSSTNVREQLEPKETFRIRMNQRLKELKAKHGHRFLPEASAELNVLASMRCGRDDEVVLLASDTDLGLASAEIVKEQVENEIGARAQVVQISGLQTTDARSFRRQGIPNLFRKLDQQRSDARTRNLELVLNINGGFKSVLPFVSLYGMMTGLGSFYSYERTDELIRLPALPLTIDWERLAPAAEALEALREQGGVMPWKEVLSYLDPPSPEARAALELLVERDGDLAATSAVGQLLLDQTEEAAPRTRLLAAPAAHKAITAGTSTALAREIEKMRNPMLRAIPYHRETWPEKTDLLTWKTRTPSGPRVLYWLDGEAIKIGAAFEHHDRYDGIMKQGRGVWRRDFDDVAMLEV